MVIKDSFICENKGLANLLNPFAASGQFGQKKFVAKMLKND